MATAVGEASDKDGFNRGRTPRELLAAAVLLGGAILLATPTMIFVIRETWSGEEGAHGPIVLFTGLWLLWREWPAARMVARAPPLLWVTAALGILLPLFVFARVTQIVELEGYLMYGALLTVLYSIVGGQAMRRLWFPLLYLAFIFPPPESVVAAVTTPLKMELSRVSILFLDALGYPIGGEGVRIFIGQYELLVAAACSGLNSIISLTAISLFYIYLRHQADWRYAALLVLLILPVALMANFLRVIILILLTYHAGEAAAQGFLHDFAGIFMFAIALAVMFGLDELIRPIWQRTVRHKHV
jgi:exosortase